MPIIDHIGLPLKSPYLAYFLFSFANLQHWFRKWSENGGSYESMFFFSDAFIYAGINTLPLTQIYNVCIGTSALKCCIHI